MIIKACVLTSNEHIELYEKKLEETGIQEEQKKERIRQRETKKIQNRERKK